jgi:hypothetical protein
MEGGCPEYDILCELLKTDDAALVDELSPSPSFKCSKCNGRYEPSLSGWGDEWRDLVSSDNDLVLDESADKFRDNVRSDGLLELSRACGLSCAGANDILNDPSTPALPSYSSLAKSKGIEAAWMASVQLNLSEDAVEGVGRRKEREKDARGRDAGSRDFARGEGGRIRKGKYDAGADECPAGSRRRRVTE